MLAYLFTHWSLGSIAPQEYEAAMRSFRQSLAASAPNGFQQSWSLAVQGLPWANRGQAVYEDWYLVDDFAALGILNEAAINAPHGEPHMAVARMASDGKGGVYALAHGSCKPAQIRYAAWFGKPAGMTYATCFQQLATITNQPGTALWQRQMVLGPGPEFCLHSAEELLLPKGFQAFQVKIRPI